MNKLTTIRRAVLLATVCTGGLLTACGGGSDIEDAAAATQEAAQAVDAVEYEQIGVTDEISTAGWTDSAPTVEQMTADAVREHALAVAAADPGAAVKWNPGHYILVNEKPSAAEIQQALTDIQGTAKSVRGLFVRYGWDTLEPAKGVYDFGRIERDLNLAAARGKRIFMFLSTKSFNYGNYDSPAYLRSPEYDGGVYKIQIRAKDSIDSWSRYGSNIKLYNDNVKARLIAMVQALGARFNKHPNFEGVSFVETALGRASPALTGAQTQAFFKNLADVNTAAKAAFPNTVVLQHANFPQQALPILTEAMKKSGVGLAGPDILPDHEGLVRSGGKLAGAYSYHKQLAGKVPLGINASGESYMTTDFHGAPNPQSPQALLAYARDHLKVNYLFWMDSNKPPVMGYNKALSYMKSADFPKDAAGGLPSACPTMFPSCASTMAH